MRKIKLVRNSTQKVDVRDLEPGDYIKLGKNIYKVRDRTKTSTQEIDFSNEVLESFAIPLYGWTYDSIQAVPLGEEKLVEVVESPYSKNTESWIYGDMPGEIYIDYLIELGFPEDHKLIEQIAASNNDIDIKEDLANEIKGLGYRI